MHVANSVPKHGYIGSNRLTGHKGIDCGHSIYCVAGKFEAVSIQADLATLHFTVP